MSPLRPLTTMWISSGTMSICRPIMIASTSYLMERLNLSLIFRKLRENSSALPTRYDAFERGWISGAHSKFLVIDALPHSSMIGVHFKPGRAAVFLGVPADQLAGQVVELDAVWGDAIWDWRDELLAARTPDSKFGILERLLSQRLAHNKLRQRHSNA